VADSQDNQDLAFLPAPPKGHFWEVKPKSRLRTKPLRVRLIEAFREGSPVGETIGEEFAEANEKSLTDVAHLVLIRTADRKKYEGTYGVSRN